MEEYGSTLIMLPDEDWELLTEALLSVYQWVGPEEQRVIGCLRRQVYGD